MTVLRLTAARVGGALIFILAGTVSARLFADAPLPPAIGVRGLERAVLPAAYPAVVLGLVARRPVLVVAAGVFAALHLASRARLLGRRELRPVSPESLRLRVVTANLLCTNPHIRRLADELVAEDADVVAVQEVTPAIAAALEQSALWSAYPHRRVAPAEDFHGAATFSRFPVHAHEVLDVAGSPMLRTDVATPHGPLGIVNVHTVAPLTVGQARRWRRQLTVLSRLVEAETGPLLLVGDFNATGDHRPFRLLVRGRLRDAFDAVGRGSGATWPVGHRVLPRLLRLDHVLVTPDVEIEELRDAESTGSDHARLTADLGIRKPAS
ncbi:endonuclease/exonuclease/phosphatase family protein [Microbacterium sp. NPDC090007]|uniref:endonuclease/exonuclease/phosphatase family protein n=1 Tax=Microbacterium sp. NPDC090007 TaxID=3364204 RepID=UPI003804A23D